MLIFISVASLLVFWSFSASLSRLLFVCIQACKCKCGCSRCSVHRSSSLKRRFYVFNMNRAKLYFQQNCSRTSVCVWCSGRGWAKKPSEYERKYFRLNSKESMISIFSCGSVQRFYISGFHELFINILKTTFYLKISFRVTMMVQCCCRVNVVSVSASPTLHHLFLHYETSVTGRITASAPSARLTCS